MFQAASPNGVLSNGHITDLTKSNGHTANGYSNSQAADYYVKASPADLHLRSTASVKLTAGASDVK
jgi:hypothetical protein